MPAVWLCLLAAGAGAAPGAAAAAPTAAALSVGVGGIRPGGIIPDLFAYCNPVPVRHTAPGPNRSPSVRWGTAPAGTASYALIMYDTDVPVSFDLANKEGQVIPADFQRRPFFYHWVLIDIPAAMQELAEGAESEGHEAKPIGPTPHGLRGVHDAAGGGRGGYDGPCPPWNDALAHHYHFAVYALNVASLGLSGAFTGADAMRAMEGHVLAQGEVVGLYTQNPDVAKTLGAR